MVAEVLGVDAVTSETVQPIDYIEVHPANYILFVFKAGGRLEYIWKNHSRKDSWSEEMKKKVGEKPRDRHNYNRKIKKTQA